MPAILDAGMYAPPAPPCTPVRAAGVAPVCHSISPKPHSYVLGFNDDPSGATFAPASLSDSPGSPTRGNDGPSDTPRTLRRKRSSANAALTSRPSMMGLRDRAGSRSIPAPPAIAAAAPTRTTSSDDESGSLEFAVSTLNIETPLVVDAFSASSGRRSTSAPTNDTRTTTDGPLASRFSTIVPKACLVASPSQWQPALQDVILVHVDHLESDDDRPQLGHALIQPNLLVTRAGRVVPIVDHAQWSALRATVEQTRIVHMSQRQASTAAARCVFDVKGEEDGGAKKRSCPCSTFYIQSQAHGGQRPDAEPKGSLMVLTVQGVGGGSATDLKPSMSIDERKWDAMPSQVCALLRQTDEIIRTTEATSFDHQHVDGAAVDEAERQQLCSHLVSLVAQRLNVLST